MRLFKRILLILLSILLLAVSTVAIIGFYYEDEVKKYLIGEINKRLNTRIIINSKGIQFSVLKKFPYASLEFNNVQVLDAVQKAEKDTLLKASSVSLQFNIIAIFNKNYRVKKIVLKGSTLNIRYDRFGNDNYHFWKSTPADTAGSTFFLEKILLEDVRLNYRNDESKLYSSINIEKGIVKGNFSSDLYDLESSGNLFVNYFRYDDVNYVDHKKTELQLDLHVDHENYRIKSSHVRIADLDLDVSGDVAVYDKHELMNLSIKGKDMNIGTVVSILPDKYRKYLQGYESNGEFYFESTIKGKTDDVRTPVLKARFGINKGEIIYSGNDVALKHVNLKGSLLKSDSKEELVVDTFSTTLEEGVVNGSFRISNFSAPYMTTSLTADIDLAETKKFLSIDTLESLSGKAKLNLKYSGKVHKIKKYSPGELKEIRASGQMVVSGVNMRLKNNPLEFDSMNGSFLFDNNDLAIDHFSGKICAANEAKGGIRAESDFLLKGILKNLFPHYFSDNETLEIEATLKSHTINLNQVLQNKAVEGAADTVYALRFPPFLRLNLNCEVNMLSFRSFEAKNIKGNLRLDGERLSGDAVSFSTMDGEILITDGIIDASHEKKILITCNASLKKININKMFTQLENFGQDVIVDKNLKGYATADIQFASLWSPSLNVDPDKIYVISDVTIEKGELIKFGYLKSLSKFVKLSELENVKFSTLHNRIEIKNQKIYIPKMEINSSALNITASGTHSFNNEIDYKIRLLLSEILFKKARTRKKENDEFGVIENDGPGKTALYFLMTGTVYDPIIKYDRKSALKTVQEDIKNEKKTLKNILKDEFRWYKKDSLSTPPGKEEKDKFIIKWDESESKDGKDDKKRPEEEEDDDF